MRKEDDLSEMTLARADLKEAIYELLNEWMLREDCKREPDTALGFAIGALAEAGGDYSATYRLLNGYTEDWSMTYIEGMTTVFANQHFRHLADLLKDVPLNEDRVPKIQ